MSPHPSIVKISWLVTVLFLAASGLTWGEETALSVTKQADPQDDGYCAWVLATADSKRAPLMYPEIYSQLGPTASGSQESGDENSTLDKMALRWTLGLQYRFINLHKGLLMAKSAEAECRRHRVQTRLQGALAIGSDWGRKPAFEAQAEVIEKALPEAKKQLDKLYDQLANNLITVEELYSSQMKVDALREMSNRTKMELERLDSLPQLPDEDLAVMLDHFNRADDDQEHLEGRLRRAQPWSFDLKGGYDQNFGAEKDFPYFVQLMLSFNFGAFAQPSADRRAAEGRRRWREKGLTSLSNQVENLERELSIVAHAERMRLDEVARLADELAGRLATLERIDTEKSRRFHDLLWLDYVRLKAERRYLETHLQHLSGFEREEVQ